MGVWNELAVVRQNELAVVWNESAELWNESVLVRNELGVVFEGRLWFGVSLEIGYNEIRRQGRRKSIMSTAQFPARGKRPCRNSNSVDNQIRECRRGESVLLPISGGYHERAMAIPGAVWLALDDRRLAAMALN
jgi:hypothetical protein